VSGGVVNKIQHILMVIIKPYTKLSMTTLREVGNVETNTHGKGHFNIWGDYYE